MDGGMEEKEHRERCEDSDSGSEGKQKVYLGCLTRKQLLMLCVATGLSLLLIIITVTAVVLTNNSGSSGRLPLFPTGGDMLDFLVQTGDISEPDGLLASWYHRANNNSEMNKALASDVMILEADVTVEGFGTANQKPVPIMAHPPAIYSDNTLDQWLEAVLDSRKGIKLDFKSLASVGLSLDLLKQKNISRAFNRPVWLNADILTGPNVPDFIPPINGPSFLQLIQQKFPEVTVSPGWKVLYIPQLPNETYSRSMVEEMYDLIKHLPQKVTFPVHALMVHKGWQHISWLLSQSPRFSLTLWQGTIHPNVSDLLFVRDNSHPARVYYDIYEPTLSAFKQAVKHSPSHLRQGGRLRRFYPGGDLMDYFYPTHNHFLSADTHFLPGDTQRDSLNIHWFKVTDRASLLAQLAGGGGGMLVVRFSSDFARPGVPLVEGSGTNSPLTLQDCVALVQSARGPWGLYLQVTTQNLLESYLRLLSSAYSREQLYRPVWANMEGSISCHQFISSVNRLFPYVTLVFNWPPQNPNGPPQDTNGPPQDHNGPQKAQRGDYSQAMLTDLQAAVRGVSQRVALQLKAELLPSEGAELDMLIPDRYDLVVEEGREGRAEAVSGLKALMAQPIRSRGKRLYLISDQSRHKTQQN